MILAVYGTLKKGFPNHHFIGNSQYLGEHITPPNYTMYSLGGFPAVCLYGYTPIHTEVYKVTSLYNIENIFMLEGYTPKGKRNMYELCEIDTPYGKANMFYMKDCNKSYKQIKSGIWK
jgi:gamma-glutamylcyclotransferase (GGCT)/AIG2-like uncharacterized protein YtfP